MNNISAKPRTHFPRDGHRTAVIGMDQIVKMTKITKMKWLCRGIFTVPRYSK